jgi:hypothetical protein
MPRTLLVETLVECSELERLYDSLPSCETADIEKRISKCHAIVDCLRARFLELQDSSEAAIENAPAVSEQHRAELAKMDDCALLRYGTVLKYICTAEAGLADMPLDDCVAKLREARIEWRRRFPNSAITESV